MSEYIRSGSFAAERGTGESPRSRLTSTPMTGRHVVAVIGTLTLIFGLAISAVQAASASAAKAPPSATAHSVALARTSPVSSAGADPAGTIYVSDEDNHSVDVFAAGTNGDVAPIRTISGPNTGITGAFGPDDVKVDANGDVYSSNFDADSITEFAPGASGNATPICTIVGPNTGLDENDDISLASDGTIYVGNFAGTPVEVFAPGACGNVSPIRTLSGSNTGLGEVDGLGVDAAGNLYVDNTFAGSVEVFAPGATGNVAPSRTISGPLTQLSNGGFVDDIVVGFNGEINVTTPPAVLVFAPGASGNVAPIRAITGTNTDLQAADDLGLDANGNIYVTDEGSSLGPAVLEFAATANGNVAPIASITGPTSTLSGPEGVAVAGPPGTVSATLTSQVASSSISLGQSTHDTGTLAGGTSPTGSLVFKLFGPNDSTCSAAPAYTSPLTKVTGDGNYVSPSFGPTVAGVYRWVDLYSGDSKNTAVSTACNDPNETVTVSSGVTKKPTTTITSLSGGGQSGTTISVPPSTTVTDKASISGTNAAAAGGTVTYAVYSDANCKTMVKSGGTVTVTSGKVPASNPVTLSTGGPYYWQAVYSGDGSNDGSTSTCGSEVESLITASTPTCALSSINVGPPSQAVFTVKDTGSGLASVKVIRHHDTTGSISSFTPGTKSPVMITFTKKVETAGGNAGVKATNEAGTSASCAGQFKTLKPSRVNSQGFTFRKSFNTLVIKNGSVGLKSVAVTLNGSTFTVVLTPGETFTQTLSGLTGSKNKMVVEGFGKGKTSAVVAVWGSLG